MTYLKKHFALFFAIIKFRNFKMAYEEKVECSRESVGLI